MDHNDKKENSVVEKISSLCTNKNIIYFLIVLSFSLMYFFLRIKSAQYPILALFAIVGLLIYVYLIKYQDEGIIRYNIKSVYIKVILCIYCLCFISSLFYLDLNEVIYKIPLIYYLLISICITSLFLVSATTNGKYRALIIFLIVILAANIYFININVFPFGVYCSQDTHAQIYKIVLPIIEKGVVPTGFTYTYFPLHQIFVSSSSIITGINPIKSYFYLVSLQYIFTLLFIYVICKHTIGSIYTEFSMIFYLISPEIIYNSTHAYQYSYALPVGILFLFITVLLTTYKISESNFINKSSIKSWTILKMILLMALIWTHHFTSILIFSLILMVWSMFLLLNLKNRSYMNVTIVSFIVILLAHWMYVSSYLDDLINVINIYYNSLFDIQNYEYAITTINLSYQRSFLDIVMNSLVKGIMLSFTIIATLYGVWKKDINVYIIGVWGLNIFILSSIGAFIKMPLLMPGRLFSLLFIVSVIYLAAKGTYILKEKTGIKGIIFISIIIFCAAISGLGNVSSGTERSLFVGNEPSYKLYDTEQDLKYQNWIIQKTPTTATIRLNEPWKLSYADKKRNYNYLPVNDSDLIESSIIGSGEYIILSSDYLKGFRVRKISEQENIKLVNDRNINPAEAQKLNLRLTKLNQSDLNLINSNTNNIYSSQNVNICIKQ